jgi:citrate synthase
MSGETPLASGGEPVYGFFAFPRPAASAAGFDWEKALSAAPGVAEFHRVEGAAPERLEFRAPAMAANLFRSRAEEHGRVSSILAATLMELAEAMRWAAQTPFECEGSILALAAVVRDRAQALTPGASRRAIEPARVESAIATFCDSLGEFAAETHLEKKKIDWVDFGDPADHPHHQWHMALKSVAAYCLELHARVIGFPDESRLTRDVSDLSIEDLFEGFLSGAERLESFPATAPAPGEADDAPVHVDFSAMASLFEDMTPISPVIIEPDEEQFIETKPQPQGANASAASSAEALAPAKAPAPQHDAASSDAAAAPAETPSPAPLSSSDAVSPAKSAQERSPAAMSEQESGSLHWKTAIAKIEPNEIRVRGYRLEELMGRVSFSRVVYLTLRGELPTPSVGKLLDAILVSSVDHGATPPSALAAIQAASTGAPLNAAIASGILSINKHHGGAVEDCMRHILDGLKRVKSGATPEAAAQAIVDEAKAAKKRLPGFGHRLHDQDPRTARLFDLAAEANAAAEPIALIRHMEQALAKQLGKPLPINVDGAIAAVLAGLGFAPEMANFFFILGRVAGMAAHIEEEWNRQKPMRRIHPSDHSYDGPADRELSREEIEQ